MIWFTADLHLGHEGILMHQRARMNAFGDVPSMDDHLIEAINAYVRPDDELYMLGDFAWKASKYGHYRQRLNVRKFHVVRGNHDAPSLAKHCSTFEHMLFRKFRLRPLDHEPIKVHMCHWPLLSWDSLHYGGVHLYGHSHGTYEDELEKIYPNRRAMDVGIDNIHFLTGEWRPINLEEIYWRLDTDRTVRRLPGPFEEPNA